MSLSPPAPVISPGTTLAGPLLWLARLGWGFIAVSVLALLAWLLPFNPRTLIFDAVILDSYWLVYPLIGYRAYITYILFLRYLVVAIFYSIAVLIALRKSNDWLALLTSTSLICLPYLVLFAGIVSSQYQLDVPGLQLTLDLLIFLDQVSIIAGVYSLSLVLLVFPDGRIEPRRFRRLILAAMAGASLFLFTPQLIRDSLWFVWAGLFLFILFTGVIGQVYRYFRVSTFAQRQQTKWIIVSLFVNLVWVLVANFIRNNDVLRFTSAAYYGLFELHFSLLLIALFPVSLAIAVLRYHLYDIDLIIRRTLVYSLLTTLLALAYYTAVTILQNTYSSVSNQQSPVIIVVSTLMIAALFAPLRRRLQNFIDRRFYRQKYNAEQAQAQFAAIARSEVDLERLTAALLHITTSAIQPEQVSLHLSDLTSRRT